MSCHQPKQTDRNKYIGIEIEFYSKYSDGYVQTIFKKNKALQSFCKLGTDGSIEHEYDYDNDETGGHELRILTKVKSLKKNLVLVQNFLKMVQAEVNKTCGLHVHLDARNFDAEKMLKNLTINIRDIEGSVPTHRLKNDYSSSIKTNINSMLNMIKYYKKGLRNTTVERDVYTGGNKYITRVHDYYADKYKSINIESMLKYKTIEVRCHEGTVNCAEIYKWCQYLCGVAYEGKISKVNKTYIKKRITTKGKYEAKRIAG